MMSILKVIELSRSQTTTKNSTAGYTLVSRQYFSPLRRVILPYTYIELISKILLKLSPPSAKRTLKENTCKVYKAIYDGKQRLSMIYCYAGK